MTETRPVRAGEEIDAARLLEFLKREQIRSAGDIEIEQFPAGSSNLTYLVRLGTAEYVLRRPPFGNTVKSAHDMQREFHVLSRLSAVYPPAPRPLLFCADASVIGSEFFLMERREGLVIRGEFPPTHHENAQAHASARAIEDHKSSPTHRENAQARASARAEYGRENPPTHHKNAQASAAEHDIESSQEFRQEICRAFIANLAALHAIDPTDASLGDLGKPDGYCRRQVEGWSRRYLAAKTDVHRELEPVMAWLSDHIPAESGAAIIHNDYKFDNVMLDPSDLTRITAVLDWEMVTIGDPLMDLGTTLGYWMSADAGEEMLSMPFNPRILMQNITRSDLIEMYASTTGRELPDMLFYYVFGTFKIAVIAQQIYARYVHGFTSDRRFAGFGNFVAALGRIASKAIDSGKL